MAATSHVTSYRELRVWIKAMALAEHVYAVGRLMPREEQFRMTSQMLRAAVSIPANIAEGYRRASRREYAYFVSVAHGSLAETETFLLLAPAVGLIPAGAADRALEIADDLSRMLRALRSRLQPG